MLIKGKDLNEMQRRQVLAAYVHRQYDTTCRVNGEWTAESDEKWLAKHAFHFIKDGSRMPFKPRYAEPVYKAKDRVALELEMAEAKQQRETNKVHERYALNFEELREEVAEKVQGAASVVRCQECKKVIMVVFKDFWIESDDRHTPDDYHQITSDMAALCEQCHPPVDAWEE